MKRRFSGIFYCRCEGEFCQIHLERYVRTELDHKGGGGGSRTGGGGGSRTRRKERGGGKRGGAMAQEAKDNPAHVAKMAELYRKEKLGKGKQSSGPGLERFR